MQDRRRAAEPATRIALLVALVVGFISVPAARAALDLVPVADGFDRPLDVESAGDGSGRLFVVEQVGRVWIVENGAKRFPPFLDISDRISCCGGRGLLGLAFHPEYTSNGFVFANYTDPDGDNVISRFRVSSSNPNRVRANTERELFQFEQPTPGHNSGDLVFGPDGYLYVASGDGSDGGDPGNNSQSLASPLGKILRLDVDTVPAQAPADNPFVDQSGALPEVWAYGLRNPWRVSFDRETGDLFLADVGQERLEEIDFQPASSTGGENYGWRLKEASLCFEPETGCDDGSLTSPIIEYPHSAGCAVTGGFRYRGRRQKILEGVYVYGDFCSGSVWGAEPNRNGAWISRLLESTDAQIVSFGEDERGEIYLVDYSGSVSRLASRDIFASGFESGDFSGWKRKSLVEVVEPGLGGSGFALSVSAGSGGGTGPRSFVRTSAPDRESALRVEFLVTAKDLDVSQEDILLFSDRRGSHLSLQLDRVNSRRYRVSLYVRDPSLRLIGRTRIGRKATRLAIEWLQASTPTAADGVARLVRGRRVRAQAEDLRTGGRVVNALKAGFPLGTKGTFGRLLFDEFVISRLPDRERIREVP